MDAEYIEGGIYLNIGDLLQMRTADKLIAIVSCASISSQIQELNLFYSWAYIALDYWSVGVLSSHVLREYNLFNILKYHQKCVKF